jgi:hypothetical protein
LDAVRGLALLMGIVFHATMSFLPGPVPLWAVQDNHRSVTLGVLFFSLHTFRMTTFFLIAGFFAHMSLHRLGAGGFIRDRLKRIALPLVVGWPILFVSIVIVSIWAAISAHGGHLPKAPPPSWPAFPSFPLTHLWFLYVLLEFYAAALILCSLVDRIDRGRHIRTAVDRLVGLVMRSPLAAVFLAAPVGFAFMIDPKWLVWFGVPAPDMSLVTNPTAAIGYGFAFGLGWLLHRQVDLIRVLERRWPLNLALAVGLVAACLAIDGVTPRVTPITDDSMRLLAAAGYALATWASSLALIGLSLRFLSGFSPVRRYIADASYWLYLIHLPILMALQVLVAPLDWPWPIKFGAVLGVAFPLMFASYQLMVRYTFIGAVLNGRRAQRPAAALPTQRAPSKPAVSRPEAVR